MNTTTGPECPECGCPDTQITKWPNPDASWFGQAGQALCNHCGHQWGFHSDSPPPTAPPKKVVRFLRIRCPQCNQAGTAKVTTTEKMRRGDNTIWAIRRYHKCTTCQHTFKSIEEL